MRKAALFALLICASAAAQQQTCQRLLLPLQISDPRGVPYPSLTAEDLTVKAQGKPAEIVRIEAQQEPRVVIVLDRSGSMEPGDTKKGWRPIGWQLADEAIRTVPHAQLVAVVLFNDKVTVIKTDDWADMRERFLAHLQQQGRGETVLWEALDAARKLLTPVRLGDAILLISDGGENRSKDPERKRSDLERSGVRLFAVAPVQPIAPTPEEVEGPATLGEVAQATAGNVIVTGQYPGDSNAVMPILEEVRHYYLITVEPTRWKKDGRLEIRLNKKKKLLRGYQLSYWSHPTCAAE